MRPLSDTFTSPTAITNDSAKFSFPECLTRACLSTKSADSFSATSVHHSVNNSSLNHSTHGVATNPFRCWPIPQFTPPVDLTNAKNSPSPPGKPDSASGSAGNSRQASLCFWRNRSARVLNRKLFLHPMIGSPKKTERGIRGGIVLGDSSPFLCNVAAMYFCEARQ